MSENDEVFTNDEPIEDAKSNIIDKGRYKFKVLDIFNKVSDAGNALVVVDLALEGNRRIKRSLMKTGWRKFVYHNFLFSLGIRTKTPGAEITKSRIICKEGGDWQGLVDIGVEKKLIEEGVTQEENKIENFSPIDKPTAPVADVPAETEPVKAKEENVSDL